MINLQSETIQYENDKKSGVIHKKKRKNVESKDAQTQTDRSDYMVIKQKQNEKKIYELAKSGVLPPGVTAQQLLAQLLSTPPSQQNPVLQNAMKPPLPYESGNGTQTKT